MNWTLHVFKLPPLIRVTLRGRNSLNEIRRLMDVVGNEVDDLKFTPLLFDDRELNTDGVTVPELIEMRNLFLSKRIAFACRKIAILTARPPSISLASTFKRIAQPQSSTVIDVFLDEHKALGWLSEFD